MCCWLTCSRALSLRSTATNALDSWVGWHQQPWRHMCANGALTSLTDKVALPTKTVKKERRDKRTAWGRGDFVQVIISAVRSSYVSFPKQINTVTQEEHRLFVSHPCTGRLEVTVHAAVSVASLALSLTLFLFLSLYSYAHSFSCTVFISHCALLSLSLTLFLWWYLAAVCMYVMCARLIGQHLQAGCLYQGGPATYGNIFSLIRTFTITRMFPGFPLYFKEILQHLSDFHISAFYTFWGGHEGIHPLWICVWVFDWMLKSNSCRLKWKQAPWDWIVKTLISLDHCV